MSCIRTQPRKVLQPLALMLLFAGMAGAQIAGLCNTGQTSKTISGCTGLLVAPNPSGGGPNRDGNWQLAFPYPSTLSKTTGPCTLKSYVRAWVDYNSAWLSNGASTASEWITPYDGEGYLSPGWYVYRTEFHVPDALPGGGVPTGVTIDGRLASDNSAYGFYMASPANGGSCAFVTGVPIPINPPNGPTFTQWWDFSFTNPIAITPGSDLFLYVVVQNAYDSDFPNGVSSQALRVEFFASSAFN